jgi:hypothetical protein
MFLGLGPNFRPNKIDAVIPAKAGIQLSDDSCNLAQDDDGRKHGQGLFLTQQNKKTDLTWILAIANRLGKNRLH